MYAIFIKGKAGKKNGIYFRDKKSEEILRTGAEYHESAGRHRCESGTGRIRINHRNKRKRKIHTAELLGGLDIPSSGSVKIRGKEIGRMNDEQLTVFRRRNIGFVFQNYNLVPILNVYQNIVLPIELDGSTVDKTYVEEIIHLLHLEEKLDNLPNNLSGGQQQRVAIARALASKPAIILADEPTGNLDSKTSLEVMQLLKMTSTEFGQTLVMITHNPELAQIADRMIHIEDGKIVERKEDI